MQQRKFWAAGGRVLAAMTVTLIVVLAFAPEVGAQSNFKILHRFYETDQYFDGTSPYGGLILDAAGNLYGTTSNGWGGGCWDSGCGSVFQLTPNSDGTWTENILNSFGDGGWWPMAGLILDGDGNLYGTASRGGDYPCDTYYQGCGVVFELTPNSQGGWTESVLLAFDGHHEGYQPRAPLVFDAAGSLYGTTVWGGHMTVACPNMLYSGRGCGTVFRLVKSADGSWTETVLHTFTGDKGGSYPSAGVIFDPAGNLYGTAVGGGAYGYGVIFKLTPNLDGSWTEKVIHSFTGGKGGANPYATLIFDTAGNLYGTTVGGGIYGYGVVFTLTLNADGKWTENVLHQFTGGKDGANPYAGLVSDKDGNLYGATWAGGAYGYGTVFKLGLGLDGKWREHVLHAFAGQGARNPYAGVILDGAGNLYGTTAGGDQNCGNWINDCGAVFEITP